LLYDSKSAESLIAKSFYYIQTKEYQLALPHLEKALEYNPNSSLAVQMLADFYFRLIPNTNKYLEYALKGVQLNVASDSITQSYIYLGLGNALIENGFVDEAITYINKSLNQYPENYYSSYVKALILFAKDSDIERTTKLLEREWQKDTSRLDILQDVANFHYYQENYDSAFFYFEKFIKAKEKYGLDIYPHEDIKIGMVYEKMGLDEQAASFFRAYAEFCETDESIYKSASMVTMYVQDGKNDQAIEQLKVFATQDNYKYWILVFMEIDPLIKPLNSHPEFEEVMQKIKDRFWGNQARLKESLEERGLI
jgi:tetratricopeptide (TPR) repeat protein